MVVLITKNDGEQEPFDPAKLNRSLKRSGAPKNIRDKIISQIKKILYDGITTQEIYENAYELLRQMRTHPIAARYSIKRAVLELGPSGFPFERFIAALLREIGYQKVRNGIILQGKCASHEIDIITEHQNKKIAMELKFHNALGIRSDLKVALYVKARFDDLVDEINEGWLITNTRFTKNAIRYGSCAGFKMLGWDYPIGNGIERLIDSAGVHPITALTTLSKQEKLKLLQNDVVLCKEILANPTILRHFGIFQDHNEIMQEVSALCTPQIQ